MLKYILTIVMFFAATIGTAQKKTITYNSAENWDTLVDYNVSSDGKFIWYVQLKGIDKHQVILASSAGAILKIFNDSYVPEFTDDSRYLLVQSKFGEISLIDLKTLKSRIINSVVRPRYLVLKKQRSLAYIFRDSLILHNLIDNSIKPICPATSFSICGQNIITKSKFGLRYFNIESGSDWIVHAGHVGEFTLNKAGDKLAFYYKKSDKSTVAIFDLNSHHKTILVDDDSFERNEQVYLDGGFLSFSPDGRFVYYKVRNLQILSQDKDVLTKYLNLWSYKDIQIQPAQLFAKDEINNRSYLRALPVHGGKSYKIEDENRMLTSSNLSDRYILLTTRVNEFEKFYDTSQISKYTILDLVANREMVLPASHKPENIENVTMSPNESNIFWNDEAGSLFFYSLIHRLTFNINSILKSNLKLSVVSRFQKYENCVVIGDGYDLWKLNLETFEVTTLTHGEGNVNKNHFRLALPDRLDKDIILIGMNEVTKKNGFWIANASGLKKLFEDDCLFYYSGLVNAPKELIKSRGSGVYLITKQDASTSPNLYVSTDLKKFKLVSNIYPEKRFAWLRSKLVSWEVPGFGMCQGILYSPQNLDPNKKYPIIFHYYQERSNELHYYLKPSLSYGDLNIPFYVSNNYLVFVPDISPRAGKMVETIVSTVESAAKSLLRSYQWIDSTKMGLQGHSFGGYETSLIVANSSLFAAANASAGMCDVISDYNDIRFGDVPMHYYYERGQGNLNATPWDKPDIYVNSTVIFRVNKITTPLLLLNNKNDGNFFRQGIELFNALRRLRKPVWMLDYNAGHILDTKEAEALDFTIRQQQFFDYYLKDKPAPLWMVEGIPAKYKGIKSGLQLDSLNRTP
ncbi:prolyl oligopeptidase family serine peptidase [Pedobacter sp. JY14-1]|uniref:alpha/beta hydrolase family protein n=1 Tax=Pedobacter sp. JY14-1 TaxID=3034151 RepID=UPI0023E29081|nr:prolyl oligopeptidase family serine peptidase [Pedobacter sp. JY14-1]